MQAEEAMATKNMAVLFGSRSCEHDVSVVSAVQWMAAANKEKYNVVPVYLARDGGWYTGAPLLNIEAYSSFNPKADGITRVLPDLSADSRALIEYVERPRLLGGRKVVARIDVAAPIFHGLNGEDGSIQGVLELMNVPYTSSGIVGSAVGMDKIVMKQLFLGCGFPILDFTWYSRDAWNERADAILDEIENKIGYACFVKPANLGSSIGIHKAKDRDGLREAMEIAFSFDRRVVIEPAVEKPVEVNCSVLGFGDEAEASLCEAPVTWQEFLTFEEKYINGGGKGTSGGKGGMADLKRRIPAPIGDDMTARVQKLSVDIFRAMDCKGVVRIDFMIDPASGALYVNEINTIPGSLAFYLWTANGLPFDRLIDRAVEFAEKAHAQKNAASFGFDSSILAKAGKGMKGRK
jgi:D-alanine-D-alanine ligase